MDAPKDIDARSASSPAPAGSHWLPAPLYQYLQGSPVATFAFLFPDSSEQRLLPGYQNPAARTLLGQRDLLASLEVDDVARLESYLRFNQRPADEEDVGILLRPGGLRRASRWKAVRVEGVVTLTAVPGSAVSDALSVTEREQAKETELKLAEEKLQIAEAATAEAEKKQRSAELDKKQQELLIDISSHELRNPVSAIQQNAELTRTSLRDLKNVLIKMDGTKTLPSEFRPILKSIDDDLEALDSIFDCASIQGRIANDILGLAQIQLHRFVVRPVSFELLAAVRSTLKMFHNEYRSSAITLELEIGNSLRRLGPKCRVDADSTRLGQILINLLSNAIRFTADSVDRKVKLSLEVSRVPPPREGKILPPPETEYAIEEQKPIYLYFSVRDNGPGLTEEEQKIIFGTFSEGEPLTHTRAGGSGLGLWIARSLCELQLGRVEVASELGQGTVFRCFISARSVDAGPHSAEPNARKPTLERISSHTPELGKSAADSTANRTTPSPSAFAEAGLAQVPSVEEKPKEKEKEAEPSEVRRKLHILVVEDEKVNARVLERQLSKAGHTVMLAENGKVGYNAFLCHPNLEVVLMDVEMPEMNGLESTRLIRKFEEELQAKHTRIVGLTGNARREQLQACLDAGMDSVMTKPYRINELLAELQRDFQNTPLDAASPALDAITIEKA